MNRRRFLAPLAVSAAVAAGGVAGALVGVPAVSGAQEATDDTGTEAPLGEGFRGRFRPGPLDAAAEALGIEVVDLLERLRDGQTVAEVATELGVDVDAVVDAMVTDIVEQTGRDEAEVREHVTEVVNEGGRLHGGPGHFRVHHGFAGPGFDAAAGALGIERADLVERLRDGQTIAEVAAELGVDVDAVIDAMVDEARERITTFVNEGPQRPARPESDDEGSGDAS